METRITRARKVYSDGRHNAFTGIAAHDGRTFVVFRAAATHVSFEGTIKIIASEDREAWDTVAELAIAGLDLRDPKVTAFKDRLLVYCGSRTTEGHQHSMVSPSEDSRTFGEPTPVDGVPLGHWLWHIKPFEDTLYGTAYATRLSRTSGIGLYRTGDGTSWEKVVDFPVPGNETSIDFDTKGVLWALVRDDSHGSVPTLCSAEPPYSSFRSVTRLPIRLQGPLVKRLDTGCLVVGRRWESPGRRNLRTDVLWAEDGRDIEFVRSLPSGGDTSYAGWLDLGPGAGVMSYYSSHEHKMDEPHENSAVFARDSAHAEHSTPADIFLADVSYASA